MIEFRMTSLKASTVNGPFSACGTTLFHIDGAGPESLPPLCWMGFEALPASSRVRAQLVGSSLYSDSPGLAVFFAARYALEGGTEDQRAALGVVQSMRQAYLAGPKDKPGIDPLAARAPLLAEGIGAAYGGGSMQTAWITQARRRTSA